MIPPRPASVARPPTTAVVRPLPAVRSDTALVEALWAGEDWAKAALFDRHAPFVQRLLHKIIGPQRGLEIADLIHDVFVKALASAHQLREPAALRGWLQAITARTAYRALLAQKARRWLRFWEPLDEVEIPSSEVDPDVLEAYRRTYAVLDRMPARERVVFALRYVDGMELASIAATTDVSLATVKRHLARAEQRFTAAARRDAVLADWLREGDRWSS